MKFSYTCGFHFIVVTRAIYAFKEEPNPNYIELHALFLATYVKNKFIYLPTALLIWLKTFLLWKG